MRHLLLVALLMSTSGSALAKQPLEETITKEYPVTANLRLTLHLTDGTVHIYGSDQNVIKLTAIKKAYTKERLDAIKVDVTVNGDSAVIETVFPPKPTGLSIADRSGTVDYSLLVPQTCTISELTVENGEILVDGISGEGVNVRLTNGRIAARNCFSATNLTLANGGLEILYYWWEQRSFDVTAESRNGDIRIALPKNSDVRFDAATGNGWIRNRFLKDEQEHDGGASQTRRWTMGAAPTGEIKIRADSGNVRIEDVY